MPQGPATTACQAGRVGAHVALGDYQDVKLLNALAMTPRTTKAASRKVSCARHPGQANVRLAASASTASTLSTSRDPAHEAHERCAALLKLLMWRRESPPGRQNLLNL